MTQPTTLFKAEWGSRAYGTNTPQSDRDLIQVVIEPPPYVTGLELFSPKRSSTAPEGSRSYADDVDTVQYGLQKYATLAVEGNPQVLATLFLTEFIEYNPMFKLLQDERDITVSKHAGRKYLGYMTSQKLRITGEKNRSTNRPELVELHGWDTKFGMHAVRLGFQGLELMETGAIKLPMEGPALELCRDIRAGKLSKREGLDLIEELQSQLEAAIDKSDFPDLGNRTAMSQILHAIYTHDWTINGAEYLAT